MPRCLGVNNKDLGYFLGIKEQNKMNKKRKKKRRRRRNSEKEITKCQVMADCVFIRLVTPAIVPLKTDLIIVTRISPLLFRVTKPVSLFDSLPDK